MNRTTFSFTAIALWTVLAGSAQANCFQSPGNPEAAMSRRAGRSGMRPIVQPPDATAHMPLGTVANAADTPVSIAGLWEVLTFAGGMQIDDAFDVFYADGMELLNDATSPIVGNVCVGIWTQTGPRTFALHHVSWVFDEQGNPTGKFIAEQTMTLDATGQSFTGTGTYVNYDLQGNKITSGPAAPGSFTTKAQRIVMPAPPPTKTSATKAVAEPKDSTVVLRQLNLDGTASTSADGKPLTYYWSLAQGSLPAAMSQVTTANPLVTFAAGRGPYTFILTVTDSDGGISTDRVTINYAGI